MPTMVIHHHRNPCQKLVMVDSSSRLVVSASGAAGVTTRSLDVGFLKKDQNRKYLMVIME